MSALKITQISISSSSTCLLYSRFELPDPNLGQEPLILQLKPIRIAIFDSKTKRWRFCRKVSTTKFFPFYRHFTFAIFHDDYYSRLCEFIVQFVQCCQNFSQCWRRLNSTNKIVASTMILISYPVKQVLKIQVKVVNAL